MTGPVPAGQTGPGYRPGRRRCRRARGRDAGSAAVELVLLVPLLVGVFLMGALAVGRQSETRMRVDAAAQAAARAASTAHTLPAAQTAARAAVAGQDGDRACTTITVSVTTLAGFVPGGTVHTSVACVVSLTDITSLRLPGHRTLHADAYAPLDRFRAVSHGFSTTQGSFGSNSSAAAGFS
jgi:Flp pilus assembly protein TadG